MPRARRQAMPSSRKKSSSTTPPPAPEAGERARFVAWFRSAAPYLHAHRGRTFVVALDGQAVSSPGFRSLTEDLALLHTLGVRLVLVHGARPQTEERLARRQRESQVVDGVRVTDEVALECVAEAAGVVQGRLTALLGMGTPAMPQAGAGVRVATGNFVVAKPRGVRNGVDYRFTGEVRRVDAEGIRRRLADDTIVVVGPIAHALTGETFNVSLHDTAEAVARALSADKLVALVEARRGAEAFRRLPSQLTPEEADQVLGGRRRLPDDLRRHLTAAVRACRNGVRRAHLISRGVDGGLLLELFTREGAGTLVTAESFEGIRPARAGDVSALLDLLDPLATEGVLRARPRVLVEEDIERFVVVERDGLVVAAAALQPFGDGRIAELGPIVVHPAFRGTGRGDLLLRYLERRAGEQGVERLVLLTTHAEDWFRERGFVPAASRELPVARRRSNAGRRAKVLAKNLDVVASDAGAPPPPRRSLPG